MGLGGVEREQELGWGACNLLCEGWRGELDSGRREKASGTEREGILGLCRGSPESSIGRG